MAEQSMQSNRQGQIQVQFSTSIPDIELPENKRQLLVPTNIKRYGLSQILNSESMLGTASPIPLDFLINGAFLRTSIDDYLTANGLSSETSLQLQYVRSLIPPLYEASFEHNDWVSCVDALSETSAAGRSALHAFPGGQQRILSGSYDGLLRVWNRSGQVVATSPSRSAGGHTAGIKAAKFISTTQIASSGLDRTIRVWKYNESNDHFSADLKPILELYGHKGSIDSLAVHSATNRILSASTDGSIGLWTTTKSSAPAASTDLITLGPSAKRRKLTTSTNTAQRGPLSMTISHSAPTTSVIFNPLDPSVAYTSSLDHTIHTLDLVTSTSVDVRTTSHPLLCLAALPGISTQLLAAGTSARHITLLDPRVSAITTAVMTLRGHTNKVSSLAPDPESRYGLVSAGHEGDCRIWDLRMSRTGRREEGGGIVGESVYVFGREEGQTKGNGDDGSKRKVGGEGLKVFGVVWDESVGIVSAGEDKCVQINRGHGITKREGMKLGFGADS